MGQVRWLAALALLLALAPAPAAEAAEIRVQVVEPGPAPTWGYDPARLVVKLGDTVTWVNAGQATHTVTADSGAFDSGNFRHGETFTWVASAPGTYTYYCVPHPWMRGEVVVEAGKAAGAASSTSGDSTPPHPLPLSPPTLAPGRPVSCHWPRRTSR